MSSLFVFGHRKKPAFLRAFLYRQTRLTIKDITIEKPSDWRNVTLPGRDCEQYRKQEKITRILAEQVGDEVMIFPTVWSPFKIASFTYGKDAVFMEHCKQDPESILIGIGKLAEVLADWAEGYMAAGASGIYYSGQFSEPQRFDTDTWERLVKPFDLKVLNAAKKAGAYNIVHICGEKEHGFRSCPERYVGYPAHLFNWDVHRSGISLEEGRKLFGAPIMGGLDNHGLLLEGSLDEIAAESRKIIREFGKQGFMLGADCTVPATIDIARLQTAVNAAKNME